MALGDTEPAYLTALEETDTAGGWREGRIGGGIVIDVKRNEIILRGLAMPHSPRWYEGYLWLLNSGEGRLLRLDVATGKADVVCELPGLLRGLTFVGKHALVGVFKIRETHKFRGTPVERRYAALLTGVALVDIERGQRVGLLEVTSSRREICDMRFLPGVRQPNILNRDEDATGQAITAAPELSCWEAGNGA